MVLFGWWSLIVWCGAFGGREITVTSSIQKKTILDLKLFLFKTLMDWVAVLGVRSFFFSWWFNGLTQLCFVPCVYYLYTQVTFLFNFLNIFFITYQKKKIVICPRLKGVSALHFLWEWPTLTLRFGTGRNLSQVVIGALWLIVVGKDIVGGNLMPFGPIYCELISWIDLPILRRG